MLLNHDTCLQQQTVEAYADALFDVLRSSSFGMDTVVVSLTDKTHYDIFRDELKNVSGPAFTMTIVLSGDCGDPAGSPGGTSIHSILSVALDPDRFYPVKTR